MSRHPTVKWAQRSDKLFITIALPDAKDVKLKLEPEGKFFFSANAGADNIPYEIDIDLFDKVDVNESKANVGSRNICYIIQKAEKKWWRRLWKQGGKPVFLSVDWDKWIDEDVGAGTDFGDLDFSKLNMSAPEDIDFDWDKWIDEDDEQEDKYGAGTDFGDLDFSKLNMCAPEDIDFDDKDEGNEGGRASIGDTISALMMTPTYPTLPSSPLPAYLDKGSPIDQLRIQSTKEEANLPMEQQKEQAEEQSKEQAEELPKEVAEGQPKELIFEEPIRTLQGQEWIMQRMLVLEQHLEELKLLVQSSTSLGPTLIQQQMEELGKVVQSSGATLMEQVMENLKLMVQSSSSSSVMKEDRMEEVKLLVQTSLATLWKEVECLITKMMEGFQGRFLSNLVQNYGLVDMRVGRLEQYITSQGSDLKREVSQIKLQLTQGNTGQRDQAVASDALATLGEGTEGNATRH